MSRKLENLVGCKFGKLVVEKYGGLVSSGRQNQSVWLCLCECGEKNYSF